MKQSKYFKSILITTNILLLSLLITTITFLFSSAELNDKLFASYFESMGLLFMNVFPITICMVALYLLSNKLWFSFLMSNLLFVTASIVNKFKLTYRDDPFKFMDIKLFSESLAMTKRYDIEFDFNMIFIIIGISIITLLLKKFFVYKIELQKTRILLGVMTISIATIVFGGIYFDKPMYRNMGDKSLINIWSHQQQFQSKGFVYSFIYSITYAKDSVLEGYDKEKAIKDLNKYKYTNMEDDKKVNVIGIMFEAYSDFSVFETIDIDKEVYENFHNIQENSVHGDLVTNVFAGGTIDTERGFLTGFQHHPMYSKPTNSFPWYFKEQGYNTKAMHPVYGWFYNRRNVNEYLGFDSFDYYENKYKEKNEEFYSDKDFFDFVIEDYESNKKTGKPYFNFSVTYQNHGPYGSETTTEKEYLKKKPEYNESDYNIVNNYLKGISITDKAMKKLVDYFEQQDEPTVIVMFGDHKPWLGEKSTGYDMMDIDIELSSVDGFLNYYKTPYIIWGNSSAKKSLNKDFNEKKNDISPNFLMPELFEQLDIKGNPYMQYLTDLKKNIDVDNESYFKENGTYKKQLSKDNNERFEGFKNLEYYYSRNFIQNNAE